jgi:hypothetical protein
MKEGMMFGLVVLSSLLLTANPVGATTLKYKQLAITGARLMVPYTLHCSASLQQALSGQKITAWDSCVGGRDSHFTDLQTDLSWLVNRRNSGVAFAPPKLDGLRQSVVNSPRVRRLEVANRQAGGKYLLFRQGNWLVCLVPGNESVYTVSAEIKGKDESVRRIELHTACATMRFKPLMNAMVHPANAQPYLTQSIPAAQRLKIEGGSDGMIKLWDAQRQLHMKIVSWVGKGGSPYNGMRYSPTYRLAPQTFIANRLRRQGCRLQRVKKHKMGHKTGWLARCMVAAGQSKESQKRVLAFLSIGETIILITWHGEDRSWADLEGGADALMRGAWVL